MPSAHGQKDEVIKAQAFSLTKVLTVSAPVVTIVVSLVTEWWKDLEIDLTATHFTVLTVAVLAFVAVGGAADVLARAIGARAEATGKALSAGSSIYRFPKPVEAELRPGGPDIDEHLNVAVLAMSDRDPMQFLVVNPDRTLTWEDGEKISIAGVEAVRPPYRSPAATTSNGAKKVAKKS